MDFTNPIIRSKPGDLFTVTTSLVGRVVETMVWHGVGCDEDEVRTIRTAVPGRTPLDYDRLLGVAIPQHEAGLEIARTMPEATARAVKAASRGQEFRGCL